MTTSISTYTCLPYSNPSTALNWLLAIVFGVMGTSAHSQSAMPMVNPALNLVANGPVYAVAAAPDGSVVVGGLFSTVNGVPRQNIARLQADGTLDPNWNPRANYTVRAIAVDSGGEIYVGGDFSSINGLPFPNLARIAPTGSGAADATWTPSPDNEVDTLALDAGVVYAGGRFRNIGGQSRANIAKLSTSGSGSADSTWNPGADSIVYTMAVYGGSVYVGGNFSNIGGQSRAYIAKLSSTDTGAADVNWNPGTNNDVSAVVIDSSGNVYAGGYFSIIGGQPRSGVAKLASAGSGSVDANWNPAAAGGIVKALALDGNGSIYVAGNFKGLGGQVRANIARLTTSGTGNADTSWNPGMDSDVNALTVSGNGDLVAGGKFTAAAGQTRASLAVLSNTGTALAAADCEIPGHGYALAAQPGGGIIVGGIFYRANQQVHNLLRLQSDGTLDPAWALDTDGQVNALVVDNSGAVYIGGSFQNVGGQARVNIAKLTSAGTTDLAWRADANNSVEALAVDNTVATIYAGGSFTQIGGLARSDLAAVLTSGSASLVTSFNPSPDQGVYAITLDRTGGIYVGGSFQNIGGQPRANIAKLTNAGIADPTWNPSPDGLVRALALDNSGSLYAGGYFSNIGGQSRNYIARLSTSGTGNADAAWNPTPNGDVSAIALDAGGGVFVGGYFTNAGGQKRQSIARLTTSGSGSADPNWNPGTNASVWALALDTTHALYVAGDFQTVAAQPHGGIVAFAPDEIFKNGFE